MSAPRHPTVSSRYSPSREVHEIPVENVRMPNSTMESAISLKITLHYSEPLLRILCWDGIKRNGCVCLRALCRGRTRWTREDGASCAAALPVRCSTVPYTDIWGDLEGRNRVVPSPLNKRHDGGLGQAGRSLASQSDARTCPARNPSPKFGFASG